MTAKRHPAEVTADRLGDTVDKYADLLTADERDDIGKIIWALEEIAAGNRP